MGRDEGFAIADFSTSHHDDPKVKAMWRAIQDAAAMNAAMQLYEGVVLASWREGKRVAAADACPVWILEATESTRHLQVAGLLDDDAKIPLATFKSWFGAAKKRRNESRERWRRSKQKQRTSTDFHGSDTESPRGHNVETRAPSVRPSVPTESLSESGHQQPGARATRARGQKTRKNGGLEPIAAVLERDLPAHLRTAPRPDVQAGMALVADATVGR